MLLTQETGTIHPIGIVLIAGFIVVFIWGLIHDKKKANQLAEESERKFEGRVADGDSNNFITTGRELVMKFAYGTTSGYNVFQLDGIAYVMTAWDFTAKQWVFGLYDANKKCIKGQQFISTKKNPRNTKAHIFTKVEAIELWELIHRNVPSAKHVGLGLRDID